MRSALSELDVVRARSLEHALDAMHDSLADGRLTPLAGGTDLLVYLNAGSLADRRFLDLSAVGELRGIRVGRDSAVLGALTTFREIRDHALLRRRHPALVAAAAEIGAWQIQNRATVAGNIANASPAGDSLPVLLAHAAVVRARSVRGERGIAIADLFTGYRALALEPDELIVSVEVPFAPPRARAFFRKVGTRRAQSISKVVFCGVLRAGRGGVDHVRLAWGSLAPVPVRSRGAEAALLGAPPSPEAVGRAVAALATDVAPIDDVRSTREYRMAVAANLLGLFLRTIHPRYR